MVARLAVGDATVNELAAPYDVTVQAVSKHLKVLEDAGLVSRSREAQRRPVHLEANVFDLMTKWIERYRQQAEERYRRLDDVLRAMPDDMRPDAPTPKEGTPSCPAPPATRPRSCPTPTSRSCGSFASSTPRPRRSSARTPTPTCWSSGWARGVWR